MKVLSTFLLLASALARRSNAHGTAAEPETAAVASAAAAADGADGAAAVDGAAYPAATAETSVAAETSAASPKSGESYVPLFDFDLAPYNMALEIVTEALEKLAGTMEPLDVPLPLIGPGYYLEVQVKSSKNPPARPPTVQVNSVSIEGGQAQPVTEIDIILPGDSAVHQTILIPAQGQGETQSAEPPLSDGTESAEPPLSGSTQHAEPSPSSVSDQEGEGEGSALESRTAAASPTDSVLVPPIPAGTESASGPLVDTAAVTSPTGTFAAGAASSAETSLAETFASEASSAEGSQPAQSASAGTSTGMDMGMGMDTPSWAASASDAESLPSSAASDASAALASSLEDSSSASGAGASGADEPASLSATGAASASGGTSDPWGELFPSVSSSAPAASSGDDASGDSMSASSQAESGPAESGASSSQAESGPAESGASSSQAEESSSDEPTTVSEPLPFPPLGGPQQSQQLPDDLSSAETPATGGPSSDGAAVTGGSGSGGAAVTGSEAAAGSQVTVETIDIFTASDENALESSIDAVIHSVIQGYQGESTPKAAVGFALIHPRSMAA
ncbi:hypothetical protein H4R18_005068 [Coemansia javaensis]|uniref:SEA domain-containing protein n=1 Tax=Coemansia javaensis TaxID=2761396 RepID=A0A9W8H2M9_9FUNG|nr:hypothetical protein H4R18_005068 [Coemansia javaensis]